MAIDFIVKKIVLNKEKSFSEEEIINDKRLRQCPYRKTIVHNVISEFLADDIIVVEDYTKYKVKRKNE